MYAYKSNFFYHWECLRFSMNWNVHVCFCNLLLRNQKSYPTIFLRCISFIFLCYCLLFICEFFFTSSSLGFYTINRATYAHTIHIYIQFSISAVRILCNACKQAFISHQFDFILDHWTCWNIIHIEFSEYIIHSSRSLSLSLQPSTVRFRLWFIVHIKPICNF